jgi:hypothetical protein
LKRTSVAAVERQGPDIFSPGFSKRYLSSKRFSKASHTAVADFIRSSTSASEAREKDDRAQMLEALSELYSSLTADEEARLVHGCLHLTWRWKIYRLGLGCRGAAANLDLEAIVESSVDSPIAKKISRRAAHRR